MENFYKGRNQKFFPKLLVTEVLFLAKKKPRVDEETVYWNY
jgi:hypothetical protein